MKIYTVGGAVRDELLGLPVKDRDYVVVGATPEEMVRLGYKPVGREFPVFLHPETHEEYALARTERKVGRGYHGFEFYAAPDVTLEQDLARRDLTINALARDAAGRLIDPFNGSADLKAGVLRHVSAAFAEDPVRVLRVARFAARLGFALAPETEALMRRMVAAGEVDALVAERVWQELARGLMEERPLRMFAVLHACGALRRIAPEIATFLDQAGGQALSGLAAAAARGDALEVRFAALARGLDPLAVESLCARLKAPAACRELALLAARHGNMLLDAADADPASLLALLDAADAWRRPERFAQLVAATTAGESGADAARKRVEAARRAGAAVAGAEIARSTANPSDISQRLHAARLAAIEQSLTLPKGDE
ncbi:MAG TPA: multifunctional CCA tRNA nucleotidyl transferase/2'3'-cyclic phosphodiesterase/2'nucleotidase/phosphatase [Burkholderiales bacterium]|nr:multifunctional CCA tRNA nucleotidyl transferase/2'3'-cyclic phosphodiesterase/2'nucleotidase/phosphatase [Burkholderiales bacterium]